MTNLTQETLIKAIEIADGFWGTDVYYAPCTQLHIRADLVGRINTVTERVFKDALAAQLVRQVDATNNYIDISTRTTVVQSPHPRKETLGRCSSPDRTENTIIAIVESGVLG